MSNNLYVRGTPLRGLALRHLHDGTPYKGWENFWFSEFYTFLNIILFQFFIPHDFCHFSRIELYQFILKSSPYLI